MKKIWYICTLCIFVLMITSNVVFFGAATQTNPDNSSNSSDPINPAVSSSLHTSAIVVFDQEISNIEHPAITNITIPCYWQIISCRMEITAHMDPDDPSLRSVHFYLDDYPMPEDLSANAIGVWRLAPGQTRGAGTISPSEGTKQWEYDMSNCPFANPGTGPYGTPANPEQGKHYENFIPQDEADTIGYFSPGNHTIKACVSGSDMYCGAVLESWISITLYFEYEDPVGDILNTISDTLDNLGDLIHNNLNCWRKFICLTLMCCSKKLVDTMIEKHLNCETIGCIRLCLLKITIGLIDKCAKNPEISELCTDILYLIGVLKNVGEDDDTTAPNITIIHVGKGDEKEPGLWQITIEDLESGLDEVQILVDGNQYLHDQNLNGIQSKYYEVSVPSLKGYHTVEVIAINNDKDEPGDQETSTDSLTVNIVVWIPPPPPIPPEIPIPED